MSIIFQISLAALVALSFVMVGGVPVAVLLEELLVVNLVEPLVERLAHHPGLRRLLDQRSVLAVFVLRQLPIASAVVSLALGVRHVPAGTFLLGTFIGFLPEGVPLALLGAQTEGIMPAPALVRIILEKKKSG